MIVRLLAGLLLVVAGIAAFSAYRTGELGAPFRNGRAAAGEASAAALEKTADYWLGAAKDRRAGDIRGSGTALAFAIRLGRLEALRNGTEPVPASFQRSFKPHFPDAVLEDTRWTVAKPGTRLARVLARWPVSNGAVTLGDVIVFKTKTASRNKALFAHELAHVDQYRELGIAEFARRYAADPGPLEAEARKKSRKVMRAI